MRQLRVDFGVASNGSQLTTVRVTRRTFVVQSLTASCAVAFALTGCDESNAPRATLGRKHALLTPNSWVTLYPDGAIDIVTPGIELGQGAMSTLPRFLAEELDADWANVRVTPAPSDEKTYGNPLFWGMQITAGSRTCLGYFDVLRIAGAQARYVLLTSAADKWRVPIEDLETASSVVSHTRSGRRASYGELVATARIPRQFPDFVAPDDRPQRVDDFFGEPPASVLAPSARKSGAIRLKSPPQYKLIGVDAPRLDIPQKINGSAQFGLDVQLPGMVYAMVETGPVRGGVPDKIDDAAARAVPGMLNVVRLPYGVAIVGASFLAVRQARALLKITWQPDAGSRAYDSDRTLDDFSRMAADSKGHAGVRAFEHGDPAAAMAALASSHRMFTFATRSELVYHAPIEPQNATVRVADDGKSVEAWLGTQWPKLEQDFVSKILDIKPESVKIHTLFTGGSFGRRQEPGAIVDATYIAREIRRPVKVIWTREDDIKRNPFRQALACRAEAAVSPEGRILALRHRVVADSWFARMFPDFFKQFHDSDPGNWVGSLNLYDIPLQLVDAITDRREVDVCYMRGVGVTQTKFAQECLIDQIANEQHTDPLEFRLRMLQSAPRGMKVLQTVARMADWTRKRNDRALGIAYTPYSNSHAALIAEVSVNRSTGAIRVHEVWCAVDVGLAAQPAIVASQMEGGILQGMSMALFERVTVKGGAVQQSNFHDYRILRMSETPEVTVQVLSTDNPMTGAGEIGVMQIAPAINNALAQLIGTHLTSMPMLAQDVVKAMRST